MTKHRFPLSTCNELQIKSIFYDFLIDPNYSKTWTWTWKWISYTLLSEVKKLRNSGLDFRGPIRSIFFRTRFRKQRQKICKFSSKLVLKSPVMNLNWKHSKRYFKSSNRSISKKFCGLDQSAVTEKCRITIVGIEW